MNSFNTSTNCRRTILKLSFESLDQALSKWLTRLLEKKHLVPKYRVFLKKMTKISFFLDHPVHHPDSIFLPHRPKIRLAHCKSFPRFCPLATLNRYGTSTRCRRTILKLSFESLDQALSRWLTRLLEKKLLWSKIQSVPKKMAKIHFFWITLYTTQILFFFLIDQIYV